MAVAAFRLAWQSGVGNTPLDHRPLQPPFLDRHGRAVADLRDDVEFIHESPDTGKSESQTARRAEALFEGALDVRYARSVVTGDDLEAATRAVFHDAQKNFSA